MNIPDNNLNTAGKEEIKEMLSPSLELGYRSQINTCANALCEPVAGFDENIASNSSELENYMKSESV